MLVGRPEEGQTQVEDMREEAVAVHSCRPNEMDDLMAQKRVIPTKHWLAWTTKYFPWEDAAVLHADQLDSS
jgi:hypothetical protein